MESLVARNLDMNATEVGLAATCRGIAGIISAAVTGRIISRIPSGPLYIHSLLGPSLAAVLVPLSSAFVGHRPVVLIAVCLSQFLWSFTVTVSVILGESINIGEPTVKTYIRRVTEKTGQAPE